MRIAIQDTVLDYSIRTLRECRIVRVWRTISSTRMVQPLHWRSMSINLVWV